MSNWTRSRTSTRTCWGCPVAAAEVAAALMVLYSFADIWLFVLVMADADTLPDEQEAS